VEFFKYGSVGRALGNQCLYPERPPLPTWDQMETTKTILEISERDDRVFDAYGKAIFRHHPLEPNYLMYFPETFDRLDELKKSNVKYLVRDATYYPRLPSETLKWFEANFKQIDENPNIFVRISDTN
jgi:hypothetical protein